MHTYKLAILALLLFAGVGCAGESSVATQTPISIQNLVTPTLRLSSPPTPPVTLAAPTPLPTLLPTATALPPTATTAMFTLGYESGVPAEMVDAARSLVQERPELFAWAEDNSSALGGRVTITVNEGQRIATWTYAIAVPFATIIDETTLADVMAGWQGGETVLGKLVLDSETADTFIKMWGAPAAPASIVEQSQLIDVLWSERPSWTIVPVDRLSPELKVLSVDGHSPLAREFDQDTYPLKADIGVTGDRSAVAQLLNSWKLKNGNFDNSRLTRVAMTGVTALGRATAFQMEINGITTPGLAVGPVLASADIAHISHEVAFAPDCPYPNPIGDPIFCARDSYLQLLQSIGTDIVELTGNHVNDWGPENFLHSLDLYESAGMRVFGGGRNLDEAQQPALIEHNGNKIAFVGCNPVGPPGAWATESRAGSRPCDYPQFLAQIEQLRNQGYVVIATLQYFEYYHYAATDDQQTAFRSVADAGASAVSGSQGHHAQGFDFHGGSFIHYGLGNLFFDQMDMLGTRQSFVDTYIIYDGRILTVELFTSLIENYCCPRLMSAEERAQLLQTVFQASGW